jgi:anion-transporting  ArsA/GET3 family ATPase
VKNKKIEVFCGTGGVGKTTISTSRALYLSSQKKKVLLITIDPAKRLKQVLGIDEEETGEVTKIQTQKFGLSEECELYALLLSPESTLNRILKQDTDNNIIRTLSKPYGGMNEIMAVLEVQHHLNKNEYDTIVLDTPPGKHFIDFLESSRKIQSFFDKNFSEVFNFIGKKKKPGRILTKLVSTGIDKLLTYLEKVTGKGFVNDFLEAIHILYDHREVFLNGLHLEKDLMDVKFSNWFLVTSADQLKGNDAQDLITASSSFMHKDNFLLVNKSWSQFLADWETTDTSLLRLREKLLDQEKNIQDITERFSIQKIEFPEIFENSPMNQVKELVRNWENT